MPLQPQQQGSGQYRWRHRRRKHVQAQVRLQPLQLIPEAPCPCPDHESAGPGQQRKQAEGRKAATVYTQYDHEHGRRSHETVDAGSKFQPVGNGQVAATHLAVGLHIRVLVQQQQIVGQKERNK